MKSQLNKLVAVLLLFIAYSFYTLPAYSQTGSSLSAVVLPSASRAATQTVSADIANTQWRGGHFVINVTTISGVTLTPTIQGKDNVSGNYYDILVGNAINATGTTVLKVYPGIVPVSGASAADILPRTIRLKMSASGVTPTTFSAGATLEY